MNLWILKIAFVVFMVGNWVIRYPFEKKQKKNTIVVDQKTTTEKVLLFLVFLGLFILPLLFLVSPWLGFADFEAPIGASIAGMLLIPPSWWLFYRSHKDLGMNWSPSLEVREGHTLITNGVYQRMRHPMYSAIWLWCFVQALLLPNLVAGLAGLVTFGLMYFIRVPQEEKMMLDKFGEQYENYRQRTGRILPKMSG
ncbi:MAG: protein-S-isoprenylcysteine O-methyltransferase [Bacteroidota bacterium]